VRRKKEDREFEALNEGTEAKQSRRGPLISLLDSQFGVGGKRRRAKVPCVRKEKRGRGVIKEYAHTTRKGWEELKGPRDSRKEKVEGTKWVS